MSVDWHHDWPDCSPPTPSVTWMDGRDQAPLHLPDGSTHWVDIDPRPQVGYVGREVR